MCGSLWDFYDSLGCSSKKFFGRLQKKIMRQKKFLISLSLVCPHHQQKDEGRMSALNRENKVGNEDDGNNFYIRAEMNF